MKTIMESFLLDFRVKYSLRSMTEVVLWILSLI